MVLIRVSYEGLVLSKKSPAVNVKFINLYLKIEKFKEYQ